MIDKAREVALKTLYKIDKEGAYSNIALDEELKNNRNNLNEKDVGLISEIVYGTTTWRLTIDEIIKKHSNIKLKKISTWILNILRMGIYQIIFLDKIPKSAAVNESVNLAKRYGHKSSSNFVNAILRKVDKKDFEEFFKVEDEVERISKTTSMPVWIIEELLKDNMEDKKGQTENLSKGDKETQTENLSKGDKETQTENLSKMKEQVKKEIAIKKVEEICKCSNLKPKVSIRVNKLKTSKEKLKEELEKEISNKNEKEFTEKETSNADIKETIRNESKNMNVKARIQNVSKNVEEGILEDFLILNRTKNIEDIEMFKKGKFTIQDEAAGLIPLILNPKEGEKVLDACSSPGGKTTYMAELMNNKGKIEAWDIHEHRTKLVQKTAERLGVTIIETKVNDATIYKEEYKESFDKILLDVPCLGIGVLKRKPDIKWQRKKEDIEEITKVQEKILETCSKYLKSGGELVYSTCSILKEENENIIEKFVEKNKEFEIVNIQEEINKIASTKKNRGFFEQYIENDKFVKVYQNEKTDGFFICKITRNVHD